MVYEPTGTAQDAVNADLDGRVTALEGAVVPGPVPDLTPRVVDLETAAAELATAVSSNEDAVTLLGSQMAALTTTEADHHSAQGLALQQLTDRVALVEQAGGGAGTAWPGHVLLTAFAGADSTAKMRAALTALAADTAGRRRVLIIPPGTVLAPGASPFRLFNGCSIVGGIVPETEFSENCRVTVSGAAPNGVFDMAAGDTRAVTLANIGWEGPGLSQVCRFMGEVDTGRLCYSLWHGLSFDNFTSVLRKRFLGFVWSGSGYCNNSAETPIETSGSDYALWEGSKFYLDSPNLPVTAHLLHIKSGNKVTVGSVFVTGDGPTPVRVSGGQMVRIHNLEMEAEGVPLKTAGAGLFVSGGNVVVDNAWFFRTMWNPAGTGRGDNGVVHVEGRGTVRLGNATFGEYNTIPERPGGHTENHIYAGGTAKVWANAPLPWNMQDGSGTGGLTGARALQVGKAGSGAILTANYTAL